MSLESKKINSGNFLKKSFNDRFSVQSKQFNDLIDALKAEIDLLRSEITSGAGGSKKTYLAFLDQSGTNAPTPTIIYNNLGDVTWSRLIAGRYKGTSASLFTSSKTIASVSITTYSHGGGLVPVYTVVVDNVNEVVLETAELDTTTGVSNALADNWLSNGLTWVKIEVYE
jgi:hypothetical protein